MSSLWQKRQFVEHLYRGEVVAYPTEAVFGLGCDPMNEEAVFRLLALKKRSWRKGLILIAANLQQLEPYIQRPSSSVLNRILATFDEPTTWVLPAKPNVPVWLTGQYDTLAVRLTQHPLAKELCEYAQMAIVSSSANVSGCEPFKTGYQTRLKFSQEGVYTINGKVGGFEKPSRLIDPLSNRQLR